MILLLISTIFLTGFFGNSLVEYRLIPHYSLVVSELSTYLLFIYAIVVKVKTHDRFELHLSWIFILLLFVSMCSIIVNKYFNMRPIFSLRLIFRFYIFYLALINLKLNEIQISKINKILFVIFFIQLPVVAYKFSYLGFSEETIGTYGIRGGGLTAMIPIVAIGYLISWYVLYKHSIWYLVLSACFILWGLVGQKAVLFFLIPLTILGLYYILIVKNNDRSNQFRKISTGIVVFFLSAGIAVLIIFTQPRLNLDKKIGGKINLKTAFQKAEDYTTSQHPTDSRFGGGRTATTKLAFKQFFEDGFTNFIFGYGPGAMTPSVLSSSNRFDRRLWRITGSYGISGMVYIWAEYGLFGVLLFCCLFISFFWSSWKWYER